MVDISRNVDSHLEKSCRTNIDGIFFNMIGYQITTIVMFTTVYANENCEAFQQMYGQPSQPVRMQAIRYIVYANFSATSAELYTKITDFIHSQNSEVGVCQWSVEGVDLQRKESNSGLHRPQPEYVYSASENILSASGSWDNRAAFNTAVHFIDFPFRHAADPGQQLPAGLGFEQGQDEPPGAPAHQFQAFQ
jgi:hypothetical protein